MNSMLKLFPFVGPSLLSAVLINFTDSFRMFTKLFSVLVGSDVFGGE